MKLAKWPNAIQTAKKAKDRSIYDFIQWEAFINKKETRLPTTIIKILLIEIKIIQELEE